ncbi:MAG TPA: spore coat protein [Bacillales bacterium]|nr:spore coat protein [Bacillales bacterium]
MSIFGDLKEGSTSRMMELLIDDVFEKHQLNEKLQNLDPQKKQKIRDVVSEIQQKVDQLLK